MATQAYVMYISGFVMRSYLPMMGDRKVTTNRAYTESDLPGGSTWAKTDVSDCLDNFVILHSCLLAMANLGSIAVCFRNLLLVLYNMFQ